MIKQTTIESHVAKIAKLRTDALAIREESEAKFNFVTERAEKAAAKLDNEAEQIAKKLIDRLVACGLCSDAEGLTSLDAENPVFAGIDCLWEIGDGNWC